MFVPDLMHEFDLGVWKATFTHLMRILYAFGDDRIQRLNQRYVQFIQTTSYLTYNLISSNL